MQALSEIPQGYQKGHKVIWFFVYWLSIGLVAPLLLLRRHELVDSHGSLNEISRFRARGKKVALLFDHYSLVDIPIPLALYWWKGHRDLAHNIFFLIGIRWSKRLLCKGADRAWVAPPTEVPESNEREIVEPFAQLNMQAKKAVKIALQKGMLLWLSPQGTRSRKGSLEKAPEGARRFWQDTDYVVPVALEGTGVMVKPGIKFFQFWHIRPLAKVRVIVGKPIPRNKAKTTHTVVYEQARLHYLEGDPMMAGDYLDDLLAEYAGESEVEEIAI